VTLLGFLLQFTRFLELWRRSFNRRRACQVGVREDT